VSIAELTPHYAEGVGLQSQGCHVSSGTGPKVFGKGERKVRKHGGSKRGTWRKPHLEFDSNAHKIVAKASSTNAAADAVNDPPPQMGKGNWQASSFADGNRRLPC
jgi:hypothetical protein